MNLDKLNKVMDKVRYLLLTYPNTRDNDLRLCYMYWNRERTQDLTEIKASEFLILMNAGGYTKESTIKRARRKINELEPLTRGKSYNNRKKQETEVRNNINKL